MQYVLIAMLMAFLILAEWVIIPEGNAPLGYLTEVAASEG